MLVGSYTKDGSRKGRFQMRRSGDSQPVKSTKHAEERSSRFMQSLKDSAFAKNIIRESLGELLTENTAFLSQSEQEELINEGAQHLKKGMPLSELWKLLPQRARQIAFQSLPRSQTHDDSARYQFPFEGSTPRQLTQGVGSDTGSYRLVVGSTTHSGRLRYSFDFAMPIGTKVLAARDGKVFRVVDGFTKGGINRSLLSKANSVIILHEDNSLGLYTHLKPGILVKEGDEIRAGDVIALSGNTGYTTGPQFTF